jgi:hypothetical protein
LHSLWRRSVASAKDESNRHWNYATALVFLLYGVRPATDGPFKGRVATTRFPAHFDKFFFYFVNDTLGQHGHWSEVR